MYGVRWVSTSGTRTYTRVLSGMSTFGGSITCPFSTTPSYVASFLISTPFIRSSVRANLFYHDVDQPLRHDDYLHDFVAIDEALHLAVSERDGAQAGFRDVGRDDNTRTQLAVHLNGNLQLFFGSQFWIGFRPDRHVLKQPTLVAQAFPHLFGHMRRKRSQHYDQSFERFAHCENIRSRSRRWFDVEFTQRIQKLHQGRDV